MVEYQCFQTSHLCQQQVGIVVSVARTPCLVESFCPQVQRVDGADGAGSLCGDSGSSPNYEIEFTLLEGLPSVNYKQTLCDVSLFFHVSIIYLS